jgi:hypothetical protein
MRYFSSVEGAAVPRFGSRSFIGAVRTAKGFSWTPDAVVAVPDEETGRYLREYARVIRAGALRERTAADHERWMAKQAIADARSGELAESGGE